MNDYTNASKLITGAVETRRFWLGVLAIVYPVGTIFCFDAAQWEHPELEFLQRRVFTYAASLLLVLSFIVYAIVLRTHMGMVINGAKMRRLEGAEWLPGGFNWFGVNASMVYLIVLHGCLSLFVLGQANGLGWLVWLLCAAYAGATLLYLLATHRWANRRARVLVDAIREPGADAPSREAHLTASLNDADQDIMASATTFLALFAAYMASLGGLGQVKRATPIDLPVETIVRHGPSFLFGICLVISFFFIIIVVRLRVAIGGFSFRLSRMNEEEDNPFALRLEKSFYTYLIVAVISAACLYVLLRLQGLDKYAVAAGASGYLALLVVFYWTVLFAAGRRIRARAGKSG